MPGCVFAIPKPPAATLALLCLGSLARSQPTTNKCALPPHPRLLELHLGSLHLHLQDMLAMRKVDGEQPRTAELQKQCTVVACAPVRMAAGSSLFQCCATLSAKGSSGLGALNRA
eukprot:1159109-Pelagomonas_calceolata.AAC.12